MNLSKSGTERRLESLLEKMRGIKPKKDYPTMTVSKFLHFSNPQLFPIYLSGAHGNFMPVFIDWLDKQPGTKLAERRLDVATLYATAFEYVAIGAATC